MSRVPHHERIADPAFRKALDLLDQGHAEALRAHLTEHPDLINQHVPYEDGDYFRNPTLLEFIAENPIRHGTLPANTVEVARVILDFHPTPAAITETLGLVATGRVPHECGVQIPLIDLLCDHGADPATATHAAARELQLEAVAALIRRGAPLDLPLAAALNRPDDFQALLPPSSTADRHLALAFAAQFGHVDLVRTLLDAGEDPNRFNPSPAHAHSTPLHQAASSGHIAAVRLLVERGARLDIHDTMWQGTPYDWAIYCNQPEIAALLGFGS